MNDETNSSEAPSHELNNDYEGAISSDTDPNEDSQRETPSQLKITVDVHHAQSIEELSTLWKRETERRATLLDYSKDDGRQVVSHFIQARIFLDSLKSMPPRSDAASAFEFVDLFCSIMAVVYATSNTIYDRLGQNKINLSFGSLLMGWVLGDEGKQGNALRNMIRLARSVAYNDSLQIPEDELESLVNETLTKELNKNKGPNAVAVLECMVEMRYAYVGKAIADDIKDWIRKRYREIDEAQLEQYAKSLALDNSQVYEQLREEIPRILEDRASTLDSGPAEALRQIAWLLRNPTEQEKNLSAQIVDLVAAARDVSPRQARKDRDKAFELLREDEELASLVKDILSFDPIQRINVTFRRTPEDHD
jgi:hypothetical protein